MTVAQYKAIQHIAEEFERTERHFLNIRPQTETALIKRGWVKAVEVNKRPYLMVTEAGWNAVAAI